MSRIVTAVLFAITLSGCIAAWEVNSYTQKVECGSNFTVHLVSQSNGVGVVECRRISKQ